MTPDTSLQPTWRSLALRSFAGARPLQHLGIGAASLLLALLGSIALPASPWSILTLPCGLALAAMWRWGPSSLGAAAAGVLLALLSLMTPPLQALAATAAMSAGLLLAYRALRATSFDPRLERARDLGWLLLAVCLLAAPVTVLLVGLAWTAAPDVAAPPWAAQTLAAWGLLSIGMLITAAAVLAVQRQALNAMQPTSRLLQTVVLVLTALAVTPLLLPSTGLLPGWSDTLAFLPHLLLAALVWRAGPGIAAVTLFVQALTATWITTLQPATPVPWGAADPALTSLASTLGSLLAVWLLAHAAAAEAAWSEQRWEWALDGSRLGVADWHLRQPDSFVSAAWCALARIGSRGWTPTGWLQQVHADDRPALERAITQVTAGADGRLQLELRMPGASAWRWMEATLLVIERDPSGQPLRLLATLADVDDRHDAQERQRLSVSLFQHLHEGLLITDADLHVLDANPAYSQILGVPHAELIGTVPSLLRPTPADPLARQQRAAMWSGLRASGSWRGELLERRRSGELCTLQATISTVPGTGQDLHYHVLVISDITEQRVQREQLERQAHFDELTRLPNRARLSVLLAEAIRAADRDGYLLAVCYLDLDRFKPVNDRFGHAAGDRLLAELAGRLRSALRSREHWADSAARLGGDEFVLLLRAGTIEEARLAVERVLRVVAQPYLLDPGQDPVQVTASMGATVYPIDHSDADTLLRHADHAMYGAKQSGRNGYLFFDPEHRRRTEERVMAIGRVQEALDRSEFILYYQPKVDMRSGKVLGLEALLRWEHPQQGLIAPLQFLPLIENTGLSARVGDWVFGQALDHLVHWRSLGLDIAVSVNVSARHLQEPDFAQRLSELLARHPESLAPHVELEMLETAAHADIDATSALLARCRTLGVRFALDDFGTGYSTLTYLKKLPVDVLKIDRSFVHHMLDDVQDRAIVEGVIGLARTFGCTVVAEGVESPAQARALLEMGCDIGQGTGIAAPMPAAQVADWVRDYKGMFALAPATPPALPKAAAASD